MASPAPVPGTTIAGRYVLDRLLGSGSFGHVWAARDVRAFNRPVAVKLLLEQHLTNADIVARFRREAKATASLHHPNVVALLEFDHDNGVPYLVSELVGGRPLRVVLDECIEHGQPPPIELTLAIFRQICAGVSAAHAAGIIHRDLKPENVMVDGAGETLAVKVLDFGIARMLESRENSNSEGTETGRVMGSFRYMPPEQVLGDVQRVSARSDVFSLAAVLYELLTLRRAFEGDAVHEVITRILTGARPSARAIRPELPEAVDVLFEHAFAIDPKVRVATPHDLLESVDRAFMEPLELSRPSARARSVAPPPRGSVRPGSIVPADDAWSLGGSDAPATRPRSTAPRPSNSADGVEVVGERTGAPVVRGAGVWVAAALFVVAGLSVGGYAIRARLSGATPTAHAATLGTTGRDDPPVISQAEWVRIDVSSQSFALGESGPFAAFHFAPGAVAFDPRPFDIERHEVTWGEYDRWADGHADRALVVPSWVPQEPAQRVRLPVVAVPWNLARAYCVAAGAELPTEEQWEIAARAPDGRVEPWGDDPPPTLRGFSGLDGALAAVGTNARDVTPAGVFDMAGNAQEWTLSPYRDSAGARGAASAHAYEVRGLPLRVDPVAVRPHSGTYRNSGCVGEQCAASDRAGREDVGFRCARPAAQ